jgi:hypothetical protein
MISFVSNWKDLHQEVQMVLLEVTLALKIAQSREMNLRFCVSKLARDRILSGTWQLTYPHRIANVAKLLVAVEVTIGRVFSHCFDCTCDCSDKKASDVRIGPRAADGVNPSIAWVAQR